MHSVDLTYEQAVAIGQLARDQRPEHLTITNPNGMWPCTVFITSYEPDAGLTQHAIDLDGHVATTATVGA